MKLGNNGWGMKELIIYSCILLSFLLFAMVMLDSFYADLENSSGSAANAVKGDRDFDKSSYYDYENKMKDAADKYLYDNKYDINDGDFVVDLNTLINLKYIESFYDLSDESLCSGYVIAKSLDGGNSYSMIPYLICSNYKTSSDGGN